MTEVDNGVDGVDRVVEQVGKVDRGSTGLMSMLTRLTIGPTGLMIRLTEVKTIGPIGFDSSQQVSVTAGMQCEVRHKNFISVESRSVLSFLECGCTNC